MELKGVCRRVECMRQSTAALLRRPQVCGRGSHRSGGLLLLLLHKVSLQLGQHHLQRRRGVAVGGRQPVEQPVLRLCGHQELHLLQLRPTPSPSTAASAALRAAAAATARPAVGASGLRRLGGGRQV